MILEYLIVTPVLDLKKIRKVIRDLSDILSCKISFIHFLNNYYLLIVVSKRTGNKYENHKTES